jgi:hypothetical protein
VTTGSPGSGVVVVEPDMKTIEPWLRIFGTPYLTA